MESCEIEGCVRPVYISKWGFCRGHYFRFRRNGDPGASVFKGYRAKNAQLLCSVSGCMGAHVAKGFCQSHYKSFHKYGNPLTSIRTLKITSDEKLCPKCNLWKPFSKFAISKKTVTGYQSHCKDCVHYARLNRKYNITFDQYNKLLAAQGGGCVCGAKLPGGVVRYFNVDHDHACCPAGWSCGKCIRGLLCIRCNTILGLARDDAQQLTTLIKYLDSSSHIVVKRRRIAA